jgi:rare lipoprotein A
MRQASYTPPPAAAEQLPAAPIPYSSANTAPTEVAVTSQPLAPLAAAPSYSAPPATAPAAVLPTPTTAANRAAYRVQAGAFADQANAQRVMGQLSGDMSATVEPFTRADGMTLYRVMIQGTPDEGEAWALRDRVAAHGFTEARVVRPGA